MCMFGIEMLSDDQISHAKFPLIFKKLFLIIIECPKYIIIKPIKNFHNIPMKEKLLNV